MFRDLWAFLRRNGGMSWQEFRCADRLLVRGFLRENPRGLSWLEYQAADRDRQVLLDALAARTSRYPHELLAKARPPGPAMTRDEMAARANLIAIRESVRRR